MVVVGREGGGGVILKFGPFRPNFSDSKLELKTLLQGDIGANLVMGTDDSVEWVSDGRSGDCMMKSDNPGIPFQRFLRFKLQSL